MVRWSWDALNGQSRAGMIPVGSRAVFPGMLAFAMVQA